jgi:hypothetical protein
MPLKILGESGQYLQIFRLSQSLQSCGIDEFNECSRFMAA